MNIYKDFNEIEKKPNSIVTVGTFDGVHRGHQLIIQRLLELSKQNNLRHLLITFDPHPQIVLQKADRKQIFLLTTIEERLKLFQSFGIENVLIIPFSNEFANIDAKDFIIEYLVKKVGLHSLLIGYDHLFGKNRQGNEDLLKDLSLEHNFNIEKIKAFQENELIISSTILRNLILTKQVEQANQLLGYPYFVEDIVVEGSKRGRKLGFPTLNFSFSNKYKLIPSQGVYFVSTEIDSKTIYGMASIGVRPTFEDEGELLLEVHLFDFNRDLYGKKVSVNFHKFIREEKKFNSTEEIIAQLEEDKRICKKLSAVETQ